MKIVQFLLRWIVGGLFIFSGLIKANDPLGFSYKLEEYFIVFGMDWLTGASLLLAMVICVVEIVVAVAIMIGYGMRFWSTILLLMIVFFTWLTGYSAITGSVTDCGCFGDAIKLTPHESFYKDLILLALIIPIFLARTNTPALLSGRAPLITMTVSIVLTITFTLMAFFYLPFKDFRPYKIGNNIPENMVCPPGSPEDQFMTYYTLKHVSSGEIKKMDQNVYINEKIWEDKSWEIQSDLTETVQTQVGCEPPIHDFAIMDLEGNDLTEAMMQEPKPAMVIVAYSLPHTAKGKYEYINKLAAEMETSGALVYALTSSSKIEEFRHEVGAAYPFYVSDLTALKTIVRANPGILMIKQGIVLGKWHHNALPSIEELKAVM
jgi:uncharacterized membrane protein YphA (DoxX/SURF4 family)